MNKPRSIYLSLTIGAFLLLAPYQASIAQPDSHLNLCDALWSRFKRYDGGNISNADRAIEWRALEPKCPNKLEYQLRLAILDMNNNDLASARRDAQPFSIGSKERRYADLMTEYADAWQLAKSSHDIDYKSLENKFKALTIDFPDWPIGYETLARFALYAQDFSAAEEASKRAVQMEPDSYTYSMLSIASYLTKKYVQALNAGIKALNLDSSSFGDPDLMLRMAVSYASIQRTDSAKEVLSRLVAANPDAKNSPGYQQVSAAIFKLKQ